MSDWDFTWKKKWDSPGYTPKLLSLSLLSRKVRQHCCLGNNTHTQKKSQVVTSDEGCVMQLKKISLWRNKAPLPSLFLLNEPSIPLLLLNKKKSMHFDCVDDESWGCRNRDQSALASLLCVCVCCINRFCLGRSLRQVSSGWWVGGVGRRRDSGSIVTPPKALRIYQVWLTVWLFFLSLSLSGSFLPSKELLYSFSLSLPSFHRLLLRLDYHSSLLLLL